MTTAPAPPAAPAGDRRLEMLHLAEQIAETGHWRYVLSDGSGTWSPQIFRMHGRPEGSGVPQLSAMHGYYGQQGAVSLRAALRQSVESGAPFSLEFWLTGEDGVRRLVQTYGLPETNDSGDVVALFGVIRDITHERALETRLAHAIRLATQGQLAASVSHEVANPLTTVKTCAELLDAALSGEGLFDRVALRAAVRDLHAAAACIEAAVQRLPGTRPSSVSGGDLAELLRSLAADDRVDIDWPSSVTPTLAPTTLAAVAASLDLLVPAQDSADPAQVAVSPGPDTVQIEVVPRGPHLAVALSVAQGHLAAVGGELAVTVGENNVSLVSLRVPVERDSSDGVTPSAPQRRRHIVLIDDDELVSRSMARVLRDHTVESFLDPVKGLHRLLEGDLPDVILCDLMMPALNGQQLFAQLPPALQARTWIITGGGLTPTTRAFQEAMQARVLSKPLPRKRLLEIVAASPAA